MPSDQPSAFFSYSREDSEFALKLAEDLKAAGANVWLDQLDIEPGQRWARAVEEALNNAQRVLVILSPASVSSTNVEDEVAFALEEHKTIIPVLYRDCKVPFQLRPFQYVDFRTDYDRGLKVMIRTLSAKQAAAAAAAAEPAPEAKPGLASKTDDDQSRLAALTQQADEGNVQAMAELGQMYGTGKGVSRDSKQSFHWYSKAAEGGDVHAMFNLALLYCADGEFRDAQRAALWYSKAAEQGDRYAMFNLANMYEQGQGIERDYSQAIAWYTKARELDVPDAAAALERVTLLEQERQASERERLENERKLAEQARLEQQESEKQAAAEQSRLAEEKRKRQEERRKEAAERTRLKSKSNAGSLLELRSDEPAERAARASRKDRDKQPLIRSLISPRSFWGKSLWIAIVWTAWALALAKLQETLLPPDNYFYSFAFLMPYKIPSAAGLLGPLLQCLIGIAFGLLLALRLGWMTARFPRAYVAGLAGIWAATLLLKWWGTGFLAFHMGFVPDNAALLRSELAVGILVALVAGYLTARLLNRGETPLSPTEIVAIVGGYAVAMIVACLFRLLFQFPYEHGRPFVLVLPLFLFAIIGNGVVFWQLSRQSWRNTG